MAALAAGLTDRMRVGTAGILMQLANPMQVAEDGRLLELLFPGRIDLGVAGAIPRSPAREAVLEGLSPVNRETYVNKVESLVRLLRTRVVGAGPCPGPMSANRPLVWICGTGRRSAKLAARLGVAFAFHEYLAEQIGTSDDGPNVVREYVEQFRPSEDLRTPRFNVACYGLCEPNAEEAARLWSRGIRGPGTTDGPPHEGRALSIPSPTFIGDPSTCHAQLLAVAQRHGADELVIQSVSPHLPTRLRSYARLAQVFGIRTSAPSLVTSEATVPA